MSTLKTLLAEALSWPRTEEPKRSHELATIILISSSQVEAWRKRGVEIKRCCVVSPSEQQSARLVVHIRGESGFSMIEAKYTSAEAEKVQVYVRNTALNGEAPETVLELIELIDQEAKKVLPCQK